MGWWTYEFCYEQHVKQYHAEGNEISAEYLLGVKVQREKIFSQATELPLFTTPGKSDLPYYSDLFEFGTLCDLTNKQRFVLRFLFIFNI